MPGNECFYCGAEDAPLLCDGIIAGHQKSEELKHFINPKNPFATCDRALCEDCVAESYNIFFDGTTPGGKHTGWRDTNDLCPQCSKEGAGTMQDWMPILSVAAAKNLRRSRDRAAFRILRGGGKGEQQISIDFGGGERKKGGMKIYEP